MSDIKIQPSATGSATVTLTAPATGTARTVTLPDATGTLLNSDGSGANLTGLPNGSQLDHSGTTQVETTATGAKIGSTSSTQTHLDIITNTASYGGVYFQDGADEAHRGAVQYKHGDDFMHMYTAGTERMRIHSNGVTSIPAGVALGVGTANTASNVLDDYEEGTWTPAATLTYNPSSRSVSTTSSNGYYTKIGRVVTVFGDLQYNLAAGSGDFNMGCSGLPFSTSANVTGGGTARDNQTGSMYILQSFTGTTIGVFRKYNNLGTPDNTNTTLSFSLTYQIL